MESPILADRIFKRIATMVNYEKIVHLDPF
jgi:hypothetical protein